jgi:hypothetical protein
MYHSANERKEEYRNTHISYRHEEFDLLSGGQIAGSDVLPAACPLSVM